MKNFLLFLTLILLISCNGQEKKANTKILKKENMENNTEFKKITFGGGCFWCVESCFNMLNGVESAVSGYSGGTKANPTYEEVCTGETGHAEVVEITYNPKVISYSQLLDVFFFLHDPTQLNRQNEDIGTQYRSVIFYNNDSEKQIAEEYVKKIDVSGKYPNKVVTELTKFEKFWPAETYHQGYYNANPTQPYCSAVVGPKIQKFRKHFGELGMLRQE